MKKTIVIMAILMICMFSLTIYMTNMERRMNINANLSNVSKIVWQNKSSLSYDILDKEDINKIIDMVEQMEGNYISVKDTKNCNHEDMYELRFYQNNSLVFDFTVISENKIRIGTRECRLNNNLDLSTIDEIIKKVEIQNVE